MSNTAWRFLAFEDIEGVADDRVTDMMKVDANLVSTAGERKDMQESIFAVECFFQPPFGYSPAKSGRGASPRRKLARNDSPPHWITFTAGNRFCDTSFFCFWHAKNKREVFFFNMTFFKLLFKMLISRLVFGQSKHARRVFIQSVHVARSIGITISKP